MRFQHHQLVMIHRRLGLIICKSSTSSQKTAQITKRSKVVPDKTCRSNSFNSNVKARS